MPVNQLPPEAEQIFDQADGGSAGGQAGRQEGQGREATRSTAQPLIPRRAVRPAASASEAVWRLGHDSHRYESRSRLRLALENSPSKECRVDSDLLKRIVTSVPQHAVIGNLSRMGTRIGINRIRKTIALQITNPSMNRQKE